MSRMALLQDMHLSASLPDRNEVMVECRMSSELMVFRHQCQPERADSQSATQQL